MYDYIQSVKNKDEPFMNLAIVEKKKKRINFS